MPMISREQITAIHVLKSKARMDDDTYRDFLDRETGQRSSKGLTATLAGIVIDKLRDAAGQGASLPRGAVAGLDTPLGGKLRALWIAGYNLGLVRDRTDRAMLSFVERQTGVSHTRFFTEPQQGTAAVEGLKRWLARDGGVHWLPEKADTDRLGGRRSVVMAQWGRLVQLKLATDDGFFDFAHRVTGTSYLVPFSAQHYDAVSASLGRKLRAALARQPRDAEAAA